MNSSIHVKDLQVEGDENFIVSLFERNTLKEWDFA
jgi:hypothetical protein